LLIGNLLWTSLAITTAQDIQTSVTFWLYSQPAVAVPALITLSFYVLRGNRGAPLIGLAAFTASALLWLGSFIFIALALGAP
jgi:hypothetical protein